MTAPAPYVLILYYSRPAKPPTWPIALPAALPG